VLEIYLSDDLGLSSSKGNASGVLGVKMGVPSGTSWTMWIMLEEVVGWRSGRFRGVWQ
jgi:hypothetical protein